MEEMWWIEQVLRWIMGYPDPQTEPKRYVTLSPDDPPNLKEARLAETRLRYTVSPEDPNSLAAARRNVAADTMYPPSGFGRPPKMNRPEAIAELRCALFQGDIAAETADKELPAPYWRKHSPVDGDLYLQLRFDPDAVKRHWPQPDRRMLRLEEAVQQLIDEAAAGGFRWKKPEFVKRLQDLTAEDRWGVRERALQYQKLPANVRLFQGRRGDGKECTK